MSLNCHSPITGLSLDCHSTVTHLSLDCHSTVTRLSLQCHSTGNGLSLKLHGYQWILGAVILTYHCQSSVTGLPLHYHWANGRQLSQWMTTQVTWIHMNNHWTIVYHYKSQFIIVYDVKSLYISVYHIVHYYLIE